MEPEFGTLVYGLVDQPREDGWRRVRAVLAIPEGPGPVTCLDVSAVDSAGVVLVLEPSDEAELERLFIDSFSRRRYRG